MRWNAAGASASVVSQFLQLLALARLLPPREFGMAATAMALVGFAQGFADLGLSNALVQRARVEEKTWASAVGASSITGVALFLILAVSSAGGEALLGIPGLAPLLCVAGFALPPAGLSLIFQAALQRDLRFSALAKAEITAAVISLATALAWAWWRRDATALVAGQVVLAWVRCLALALGSPRSARRISLRPAHLRSVAGFGAYQMGERVLTYAASNMDRLVVARLLGPEAAGFYTVASQIALRPMVLLAPFVFRTLFPLLARMQAERDRLAASFLRSVSLLTFPAAMLYAFLIAFSDPLVHLVLGVKWGPVVPLLRVLAGVGFIWTVSQPLASLTLALGRARASFWINAAVLIVNACGVWLGARFGLRGAALGMLSASMALLPLDFFLMRRWLGIGPPRFLSALFRPLAAWKSGENL